MRLPFNKNKPDRGQLLPLTRYEEPGPNQDWAELGFQDDWGRSQRSLERLRGKLEVQQQVYELGTRVIEAKRQFSLTALQAQTDYHLQRLQVQAQALQMEAELLTAIDQAKARLRQLKLAQLADELGLPLEQLLRQMARPRQNLNGHKGVEDIVGIEEGI